MDKKILEEIYSRLDRVEALRDLNPKVKGNYIKLDCPICKQTGEAWLYNNWQRIQCNRKDNCGQSISIWDYIQEKGNLSQKETLIELARLSGYELPPDSRFNKAECRAEKEKEELLKIALDYFKKRLFDPDGKVYIEYLKGRGYTEQEIKAMELGLYHTKRDVEIYLIDEKKYTEAQLRDAGLLTSGFGDNHKLVIPGRDYNRQLKGFIVRSKEEIKPKYLYSSGYPRGEILFNLYRNHRQKRLIIVEGYLDALIGTARGIEGIVAIGGSQITQGQKIQIDNAINNGIDTFYFALDSDEAGQKGIEEALQYLRLSEVDGMKVKSYVVTLPAGYKDPDELIKAQGIEAFKECIKQAEAGIRWTEKRLIDSILSKHSITDKQLITDPARDEIIKEALKIDKTISDPVDSKYLVDTLSQELNIPIELLNEKFSDCQKREAREKQLREYRELIEDTKNLIDKGDIEALDNLGEELQSIRKISIGKRINPFYSLESFLNDTVNKKPGLKTGLENLDKIITIPQGALTIIAGRPAHGKTTLMLNIMLNMLKQYKEQKFFFFSYEVNTQALALKCITILSQIESIDIETYIKTNTVDIKKVNKDLIEPAKQKYNDYVNNERLGIIYEPYYIQELTNTIDFLSSRYNDIGAIFIDYIQKIKVEEKYTDRYLDIKQVSEKVLETAIKNKIPIILGAQLNREADSEGDLASANIREGGDIEQDANLVLQIWNTDFTMCNDKKEKGKKIPDPENTSNSDTATLKVKITKNRDGASGRNTLLTFKKNILKIEDKLPQC